MIAATSKMWVFSPGFCRVRGVAPEPGRTGAPVSALLLARLQARLLVLLLAIAAAGQPARAAEQAPAKKDRVGPAAAASVVDPAALARRTYAQKRQLVHPMAADAPVQRSTAYLAALRAPAAPGAPAAAAIADGNAELQYVRREHATPLSRGTVVLFDDRERLPSTSAMLGRVAEELALRGWDTWTLALPEVPAGAPLPRERSHARVPPVAVDGAAQTGEKDQAEGKGSDKEKGGAAQGKTAKAVGPKLSRRRWATPVVNARPLPAPALAAWQVLAQQRMALLMQAAQAATLPVPQSGLAPVVVVGAGLAADLVARMATAERWRVAALVLVDLLPPPVDLPLALDADVAALPAPTLAISWRAPDPVAPGAWLRLQGAAKRSLPTASADEIGRVIGGWLERKIPSR